MEIRICDGGIAGFGAGAGPLPSVVRAGVVREGLGDASSAVLIAVCYGGSSARTTLGIKRSVAVERWPAVGNRGGGGDDGAGLGDDAMGGLRDGEVADGGCGVVGGDRRAPILLERAATTIETGLLMPTALGVTRIPWVALSAAW